MESLPKISNGVKKKGFIPHLLREKKEDESQALLKKGAGFTFIELLVVIVLIALVASIVLVFVRQAQLKARDAVIKESFHTLRTKIEVDFSNVGNYSMVCEESPGDPGNSVLSQIGEYKWINEGIKNNNGGFNVVCNERSDGLAYAAWTKLVSINKWRCITSEASTPQELDSAPTPDSTNCQ